MSYNIYYNNNWLPLVFRLSESSIRICACIQGANMFQPSSLVACLCLTFIAGHGCRAFQLRHGLSSSGIAAQFAARCPKMKHCILEPQSWHGDPFHPQTWQTWTERFSLEWSEWLEPAYVCFGWELWRTHAAMEHEAQLARLNGWNHPCFESLEGADVVWKTFFPLNFVTQDALIVPLALGQSGPHWLCLSVYPCLPDLSLVIFDDPNVCGTLQFGPSQLSLAQTCCIASATPQIAQGLPLESLWIKEAEWIMQPYMHRVGDSLIDKGTLAPNRSAAEAQDYHTDTRTALYISEKIIEKVAINQTRTDKHSFIAHDNTSHIHNVCIRIYI